MFVARRLVISAAEDVGLADPQALQVAIAAQQLARTQIKAPFAGRVAKRMADAGTMLANGTPLFTLVDDGVLEFRASVPSADYGKVHVGAAVDVTVDALGRRSVKGAALFSRFLQPD